MILDYNESIKQHTAYGKNSLPKSDRRLFFEKRGFCPFCMADVPIVRDRGVLDLETLKGAGWHKHETIWECSFCGWWEHSFHSYIDGEVVWDMKDWDLTVTSGVLRKFAIDSKQVPVDVLSMYILKNPDKIYEIHHKKMEELVGSVFKEHYNCEVHYVGKSNDGGKDLILIESDKPIIVQVKRRTVKSKTEPVSSIRELIGATLLADSKHCIFVTTADHFSPQANEARKQALTKSIVDRFELYDMDKFMGVLNLYKKNKEKPWEKLVEIL